ncbi:MAG: glycosyltransferase [Cyanobacteriota bacterium]|nr:glycosyltransferase [Cyanobacteriota bacterium]
MPLKIAYLPELLGQTGFLTPCSSIRTDHHLKLLAQHRGCRVHHAYPLAPFDPAGFDVVFINRLALPDQAAVTRLVAQLRRRDPPIPLIVDLDDDLLAIPSDHVDYAAIQPRLGGLRILLAEADAVIVSTPELARVLPADAAAIHVLPNRVLHSRLRALPEQAFAGATDVLYCGTQSHLHELMMLRPLFDPASVLYTGLNLVVVGIADTDSAWYRALPISHPCVETFIDRLSGLRGLRCGLAPLRADDAVNAAKSEIKIFDYMYSGLPVIASATPAYRRCIRHGETGFLVDDNNLSAWSQALEQIKSDALCARLSGQAAAHLLSIAPTPSSMLCSLETILAAARERSLARSGCARPMQPI